MKKILVLGGSFLQSYFVKTAIASKYQIHIADRNEFCFCRKFPEIIFHNVDVSNYEGLKVLVKELLPAAIIPPVNELGNTMASLLCDEFGLIYNKLNVVKVSQDKDLIKEKLKGKNILFPKKIADFKNIKELKYPLIVKPTISTSSKGVTLVMNESKLAEAVSYAELFTKNNGAVIFEEYVEGDQYSLETISVRGKHFICGIVKENLSDPPYFFERIDEINPGLNKTLFEKFKSFINELLDALEIEFGPCHIEVKLVDSKIYLIDFASRSGGWRDILLLHSGASDYNLLILKSLLGEDINSTDIKLPNKSVKANILMYPADLDRYIFDKDGGNIVEEYFTGYGPVINPKTLADAFGYYFAIENI